VGTGAKYFCLDLLLLELFDKLGNKQEARPTIITTTPIDNNKQKLEAGKTCMEYNLGEMIGAKPATTLFCSRRATSRSQGSKRTRKQGRTGRGWAPLKIR
jgi:hypothetical protein